MSKFVDALSKSTKRKQIIPASWLKLDFAPFNDFILPPSVKDKAKSIPAATPANKKEAK